MSVTKNTLPLANLQTLNLASLQRNDPVEVRRLYQVCSEEGFFYLDLQGSSTAKEHDKVLSLSKRYFEQPLEVKLGDDASNDAHG